jgi:hypothetical protein
MSHNATGCGEDMNPDTIDGAKANHDHAWSQNNPKLALRGEAIVNGLYPGRIVPHHSTDLLFSPADRLMLETGRRFVKIIRAVVRTSR